MPTSFAQQQTPEREKRQTITGTVLLCTSAIILILSLLLAGNLLIGLLFATPFLICGIICFTLKQRVGLCCGWVTYLYIDLYLRFATGLSWTTIFMTHLWTAHMNYTRLFIAWLQFIIMVLITVCTMRSYRMLRLSVTKKEITWLIIGWLVALIVLPLFMNYGIMPLWINNLQHYSNFSPYFFITILCSYVRLALVNVLLVRTFAVLRIKKEKKVD